MLAGTPAYMAPEQVRSEPVDARTDIFAAGILLFELVTGERPFRGATFVDVLQAVMTEHPPALSGSAALVAIDRVVQRALAKDPADRFASAAAMADRAAAHRRSAARRRCRSRSSGSSALRCCRSGCSGPIPRSTSCGWAWPMRSGRRSRATTTWSCARSLALPASVADTDDVQRAGSELDADFVLTGTLLRSGSRVRVSAQLVEVGTGHATWAQQTDGSLDDLFELQDSMACTIMSSLPFAKAPSRDSAEIPRSEVAYRLYLQANQLARQPHTWMAARSLYRESLAADDRFAPSWAGLGRLERVLAKYLVEGTDVKEGYMAAENSLRRALELSPALPQAHYHYAQLEADTARTEQALSRLLRRLHVRRTEPEIYAGLVLVCRYCGLFAASVAAHDSAVALDPTIKTSIGLTRLATSEFDEALRIATDDNEDELRIIVLAAMNRRAEALELARQPSPRLWDATARRRCERSSAPFSKNGQRTPSPPCTSPLASTRRTRTCGRDSPTERTPCGWPASTRGSAVTSSGYWDSARRSSWVTFRSRSSMPIPGWIRFDPSRRLPTRWRSPGRAISGPSPSSPRKAARASLASTHRRRRSAKRTGRLSQPALSGRLALRLAVQTPLQECEDRRFGSVERRWTLGRAAHRRARSASGPACDPCRRR